MHKLYEIFLYEKIMKYSNRAVIFVNCTKIVLHENIYPENKVNNGNLLMLLTNRAFRRSIR